VEAKGLKVIDYVTLANPYCNIRVRGTNYKQRTKIIYNSVDPAWNQEFKLMCHNNSQIEFHVWHKNAIFANVSLGRGVFLVSQLKKGLISDIWINLEDTSSGKLHVIFTYGTDNYQQQTQSTSQNIQGNPMDYGSEDEGSTSTTFNIPNNYQTQYSLSPPPEYYNIPDDQLRNYHILHHQNFLTEEENNNNNQNQQQQTSNTPQSGSHTILVNTNIPDSIPQVLPMGVTIFQTPTRFLIQPYSLHEDMEVKDAFGNLIFIIRAQNFTLGTKMDIQDSRTGDFIAAISQQVRMGLYHFKIYIGENHMATMKLSFSESTPKYQIELMNGDVIDVEGNWKAYDFRYSRNGGIIAVVSKEFFSGNDKYGVEIIPGVDVLLIFAVTVILDKSLHDTK